MNAFGGYLLLLTFLLPTLGDLEMDELKSLERSPYSGFALMVQDPYDFTPVTGTEWGALIDTECAKDRNRNIWPWIFLNRIVGIDGKSVSHESAPKENNEGFKSIKGMDIYNKTGQLEEFYRIWELALSTAKQIASPGIVLDCELYNDYRMAKVSTLSGKLSTSPKDVVKQLMLIGAKLAEITENTYPRANIWLLSDGLDPRAFGNTSGYLHTVAYIIVGLLSKAKDDAIPLKVISGGASSIGYCHKTTESLRNKIASQKEAMKPLLDRFPNHVELSGAIAPWDDVSKKKGWMRKGECGEALFSCVDEFEPILNLFMKEYRYNLIYAAYAADYYPLEPDKAKKYDQMIRRVQERQKRIRE